VAKVNAARPATVAAYLDSLTPEKRTVIEEARAFVHRHIPEGYAEFMNWGVINWGIPLEEFSNYRPRHLRRLNGCAAAKEPPPRTPSSLIRVQG